MVTRRGDLTYNAGFLAWLRKKCLISNQHFTALLWFRNMVPSYGSIISQLSLLASHKTILGQLKAPLNYTYCNLVVKF